MEFRILGPFEVAHAGELLALGSAQQREALALLVLCAPEPVSVERLIDEVWGERPPATARHAVRVYISAIRRMLRTAADHEVIVRTLSSGYALEVSAERIDARRFERLLSDAQQLLADEPARARRRFEEALALWRGPPLGEFEGSAAVRQEARRLEELHALALEGLVEARVACGEHGEVIGALTGLLAANPLRERPRRLLMLALYRSGRHAEALAAYRDACAALDEIGLQPGPELRELEAAILRHGDSLRIPSAPVGAAGLRSTNLPPEAGSLVGRERELERLCALLRDGRHLVTLVGVGGVGKTSLAVATARRLLDSLEGGAFLVNLAAVREPGGVVPAIARSLGMHDVASDPLAPVLERLRARPGLLVLDNFEHLLGAAPLAGELVAAAPELRLIVTSQAPLRIGGETTIRLEALAAPAAVELFIDRATAAGNAMIDDAERATIAEICDGVGRLPLAIELAAARMGVLTSEELLQRVEASVTVLRSVARDAPERHRSLQATFEWTHSALTDAQRQLFRRLGVFAGAVPLSMVEAVAERSTPDATPVDALDELQGLIDFALVRRERSPTVGQRFSMPQALREMAREKLAAAGELQRTCRHHAEHIAALAEPCRLWFLASMADRARLLACETELLPAIEWAEAQDRRLHRRLLAALGIMLVDHGQARQVNEHLDRVYDTARESGDPLRLRLANARLYGLLMAGRLVEARDIADPLIAHGGQRNEDRELAVTLQIAMFVQHCLEEQQLEELGRPRVTARRSLEVARRCGDAQLVARSLLLLAQRLLCTGFHISEDAAEHLQEADRLVDEARRYVEEPIGQTALVLATTVADVALARGDREQALGLYADSLALAEQVGDAPQTVMDTRAVSWLLGLSGQTEAALEAYSLADAIARDVGWGIDADVRRTYVAALGESAAREADRAARRAEAVQGTDRVARILQLARGQS